MQNNKVYIGSTASFLDRSARHWTLLKAQTHECLELQQDFKKYDNAFFEFTILVFQNHLQKRLQLEKQLVAQQLPNKLYNVLPSSRFEKKTPVLGQQILMEKKIDYTIREAEKATNISKATILRKLNNSENLMYIRLSKEPISLSKYDFLVNGVRYSSTQEVIANNLARGNNQVRERCRSKSLK